MEPTTDPLMRNSWISANNAAVCNLSSLSDLSQISLTLEQLLTDVQSLPIPAMLPEVELTVSYNLLALTWSNPTNSTINNALTTLTRLINHSSPAIVLPDPPDIIPLLPHLLSPGLMANLSISNLKTLMDIVSLVVLGFTSNLVLCKEYLSFCDKIEKYILDIQKNLLVSSESDAAEVFKVNIINPPNTGKCDTNFSSPVLRKVVEIETNDIRDTDEHVKNIEAENQFFPILFSVGINRKQGNKLVLGSCIDRMVSSSNIVRQPEKVTRLGRLLRGEFLLDEGRLHGALSCFSKVIQEDGENIRAYIGVANCFEKLERYQNELEIWNIITNIIHRQKQATNERCSLDFVEILCTKLFPFKQITLLESVVIWARNCFKVSEYHDSAEKFLDAIALVSTGESIPQGINFNEVKQEAALALIIIGNISEALLICQDLAIARKVGGKRKQHEGKQNEVVLKFLLARCHFIKGEYETSLQYFDQSLRSCLADSAEDRKEKVVKCEQLEEEAMKNNSFIKMVRIRARLYYEKSLVFKEMNDIQSFKACISSAMKLDPNENFANFYLEFLESQIDKSEAESLRLSMTKFPSPPSFDFTEDDVVLQFILDSSTVNVLCQESDMEMEM